MQVGRLGGRQSIHLGGNPPCPNVATFLGEEGNKRYRFPPFANSWIPL